MKGCAINPLGLSFDFWETLVSVEDSAELMARRANMLSEVANVAVAECEVALRARDRGMPVAEWLGVFLRGHGAEADPAAVARQLSGLILTQPLSRARACEGVLAALAAKTTMALISNARWSSGETLRTVLERFNLARFFETMTFSDETGFAKPDARAFELTWRQIGVSPKHAIHIGDRVTEDVRGAHSAGGRSILARYLWRRRESGEEESDAILLELDLLGPLVAHMGKLHRRQSIGDVRKRAMPIVAGRLCHGNRLAQVQDNRIVYIGPDWTGLHAPLSSAGCLLVAEECLSDAIVEFCAVHNLMWFAIAGPPEAAEGEPVLIDAALGALFCASED